MPTLNISPEFKSHVDRRPRLEQLRSLAGTRASSNSRAGGAAAISAAALGMAFLVVVGNNFNASVAPHREASGLEAPADSSKTATGASSASTDLGSVTDGRFVPSRIDSNPTGAIGFGASLAPRREQVGTEAAANAGKTAIRASSPSTAPGSVGAIDRLYLSPARGAEHGD